MSKNDENNSHLFIKNNSTQNLYLSTHQKNKSSNFLSDSPSTLITVQIQSSNSNQNSQSKDKNNIENKSTNNIYSPKNLRNKNNISEINKLKKEEEKEKLNHTQTNQVIMNNNKNDTNKNLIKDINLSYTSSKPEIEPISTKDVTNYKMKYSKICGQYSANTPKQVNSVYNGIRAGVGMEQGNILVKKNLRLGIQKTKNSPDNNERKNANENKVRNMRNENNKNDYVKYVNNDKYNFNGNILNMTQNNNNNQTKYVLSQSKSFTKFEKKNSPLGVTALNGNNNNGNSNGNNKRNHNFNYINYNNYKNNSNIKKKELTVLTKSNNTYRTNKNDNNNNNINSFAFQNLSTSPNANNHVQSYFSNIARNNYIKKNGMTNKTTNNANNRSKNKSTGGNKSNNTSSSNINNNPSSKNIYFMKPTQQRKKSSYGKNHEISINNKENTTNQSSFRSKNKKENNYKNTLDSTFLSDVFNKNIENPEELHFFYIKILQNGNEISKKFEIDSI